MRHISTGSIFVVIAAAVSVHAADIATIIAKVSVNCNKIDTYSAYAEVRYKI